MLRSMKAGLVVTAVVAIAACGSTTFQSTWTAPDAGPLKLEEGTKVLGMVVSGNTAKRHGMEAALANELSEHGLEGIPAYSVVPPSMAQDAAKAKPYVEKTGASYAVLLQVTGKTQEVSSTPTMGYGHVGRPRRLLRPGLGRVRLGLGRSADPHGHDRGREDAPLRPQGRQARLGRSE
jgi:hypothetical protein